MCLHPSLMARMSFRVALNHKSFMQSSIEAQLFLPKSSCAILSPNLKIYFENSSPEPLSKSRCSQCLFFDKKFHRKRRSAYLLNSPRSTRPDLSESNPCQKGKNTRSSSGVATLARKIGQSASSSHCLGSNLWMSPKIMKRMRRHASFLDTVHFFCMIS